jgi:hypothetical protein
MNRIFQIELRDDRREIVGIVIHVVSVGDLGGAPVAAPVMRDDPVTMIEEEDQLGIPVVARKRPAVAEHDRLSFSPVRVENFSSVLRRHKWHVLTPLKNIRAWQSGDDLGTASAIGEGISMRAIAER